MESLDVDLLSFLVVDLVMLTSLPRKNLVCLIDPLQVGFVRSADQPMELAATNSIGLR
jgi:hypothetical protein